MNPPYPMLWFDTEAEDAARLYTSLFPDSGITAIKEYSDGVPGGKPGDVMAVELCRDRAFCETDQVGESVSMGNGPRCSSVWPPTAEGYRLEPVGIRTFGRVEIAGPIDHPDGFPAELLLPFDVVVEMVEWAGSPRTCRQVKAPCRGSPRGSAASQVVFMVTSTHGAEA